MGVFQRGDDYWIDYYFQGRRKREKIGLSKKLAEDVLRKRKVEIAENKFLDKKKDAKIKFKDLSEIYYNEWSVNQKRSYLTDKGYLKHLDIFFGNRYVNEITPSHVYEYQRMRLACFTPRKKLLTKATCNREVALLKAIFNKAINWAEERGWGDIRNPVTKVKLYKENNERERFLAHEEIQKLLTELTHPNCEYPKCKNYHCTRPLREIVIFVLNTGLRLSEVKNLKWSDVFYEQRYIHLRQTKSGKDRKIPLNEDARKIIILVPKRLGSDYVFCNREGNPFSFRRAFNTAVSKAEINKDINKERITFHSLRHTFASYLVMSGVDLYTVSKLLGHSDLETTQRYAHLSPDHNSRAVYHLDYQMDTNIDTNKISEPSEFFGDVVTTYKIAV